MEYYANSIHCLSYDYAYIENSLLNGNLTKIAGKSDIYALSFIYNLNSNDVLNYIYKEAKEMVMRKLKNLREYQFSNNNILIKTDLLDDFKATLLFLKREDLEILKTDLLLTDQKANFDEELIKEIIMTKTILWEKQDTCIRLNSLALKIEKRGIN